MQFIEPAARSQHKQIFQTLGEHYYDVRDNFNPYNIVVICLQGS